jgi:hypothetical protein
MTLRLISSYDGARSADELLSLNAQNLAEIVLQHLKSCEGTCPVVQHGAANRRYFIALVEGRAGHMGLGSWNTTPEYGAQQSAVSEALEEAWAWLVNEGMLRRVAERGDEWYKITRGGEACLRRLAS